MSDTLTTLFMATGKAIKPVRTQRLSVPNIVFYSLIHIYISLSGGKVEHLGEGIMSANNQNSKLTNKEDF